MNASPTRMTTEILIIRRAASAQDIAEIRQLLREYEAWLEPISVSRISKTNWRDCPQLGSDPLDDC